MTEEVKVDEVKVEDKQEEEQELSSIEQEAVAQGWVPEDDFEGDKDKWLGAAEFVRRGELFRKIDSQNRTIKETQRALAALKEHYTKVQETEYNRALGKLKAERIILQKEGEFEQALKIEDEIKTVEKEAEALREVDETSVQQEIIHPEVEAWINRNTWYKTNARMRAVADAVGKEFSERGLVGPPLLRAIDAEIRKEFPTKFNNPNREKPSGVEGNSSNTKGKSRDSFQLTAQEEKIMTTLVRDKVLTKEQYIADIRAQRGV